MKQSKPAGSVDTKKLNTTVASIFTYQETNDKTNKASIFARAKGTFGALYQHSVDFSCYVLAAITGVAFGIGGVYDAHKTISSKGPLNLVHKYFTSYFLAPSLAAGFLAWCSAYVSPMLNAVKRSRLQNKKPESFKLFQEIKDLEAELKWLQLSKEEYLEAIKHYLNDRLFIVRNFSSQSVERLDRSLDTAANNRGSVKPVEPSDDTFVIKYEQEDDYLFTKALLDKLSEYDINSSDEINLYELTTNSDQKDTYKPDVIDEKSKNVVHYTTTNMSGEDAMFLPDVEKLKNFRTVYQLMLDKRNSYENSLSSTSTDPSPSDSAKCAVDLRLSKLIQSQADDWVTSYYDYLYKCYEQDNQADDITTSSLSAERIAFFEEFPELETYSGKNFINTISRHLGAFNALFVNSIGIAMGFLVSVNMFCLPVGGVYAAAASPWLFAVLLLGSASGVACAWYLTKESLVKTVNNLFTYITDNRFYNSKLRAACKSQQDVAKRHYGDQMWAWLCSPREPIIAITRDIMIVGFSIGSSLFNYVSGVKGALIIAAMIKYFRAPGSMSMPLLNLNAIIATDAVTTPPLFARIAGCISACISFITTGALLKCVASEPKHQSETVNTSTLNNILYGTLFGLAVFGQVYMQSITTFWPHGLSSLLTSLGVSSAMLAPLTYTLAAAIMPGLVICAKLLSDTCHDALKPLLSAKTKVVSAKKSSASGAKPASSSMFHFPSFRSIFMRSDRTPAKATSLDMSKK